MDENRTRAALSLFKQAVALPEGDRDAWLARACGGDGALRDEVVGMLRVERESGGDDPVGTSLAGVREIVHAVADTLADRADLPAAFGQYSVRRLLGEGGMGLVFEAEQASPRRRVALKVLRPGRMTAAGRRRFEREVEVLGRLRHPGIAQVYEGGTVELDHGAQPFLAMELVEGADILEHCDRAGASLRQRLELLAAVADAVQHAHERGVIHRDLKPENILVDGDGQPKILDFGVAHVVDHDVLRHTTVTRSGDLVGTIAFMSPEQLSGDPAAVSARSDVYALGVLAYELLAGRLPIAVDGHPLAESIRLVETAEPTPLGAIDARLRGDPEVIVARALEKEPGRRYGSAGELADDLRRALRHEPIRARRPTALYRLRKLVRRHRAVCASVVAIILALSIGLVAAARSRDRARQAADLATRQLRRTAITAASYALASHDVATAQLHLESIAGDGDHGWEWRHVHRQLEPWLFDYEIDGVPVGHPACLDGGTLAAFALADGRVAVCETELGRRVATFATEVPLAGLARTQPPGRIVAGGTLGRVVVWDRSTGHATVTDLENASSVTQLDCAADGTVYAHVRNSVCIVPDGGPPAPLTRLVGSMWHPDLTVHPDGTRLAVLERPEGRTNGGIGKLVLWDLAARRRLRELVREPGLVSIDYSPDGRLLAAGSRQREVLLLDADSLEIVGELVGHANGVTCVRFDATGGRLVSCANDDTVRVWDVARRAVVATLRHEWKTASLAEAPAHGIVTVVAPERGAARAWPMHSPGATVLRGHESYVYALDWAPGGSLVASAGFRYFDRSVCLWDPLEGSLAARLGGVTNDSWAVFSADGRRLVLRPNDDPLLRAVDAFTGQHTDRPLEDGPVGEIGAAPDPGWLAELRALVGGGRELAVAATLFTPGDELVARRLDEETIRVSRGLDGAEVASLTAASLFGTPAISPDRRWLACASSDHGVYVWDLSSGSRRRLRGHSNRVFAVAFSPDGSRLASGGNDRRVLLWNVGRWDVAIDLLGHDSYIYALAWSPDGDRLASAGGDKTVRIWDSVPLRERHHQLIATRRLCEQVHPRVEAWWRETRDAAAVLRAIRAEWTGPERTAAERVLLGLRTE